MSAVEERIMKIAREEKLFLSATECIALNNQAPEPIWYYLPKRNISILFGKPDAKKSFTLLGLSVAICEGKDSYLGYEISTTYNKVIYVSYEDNGGDLGSKLEAMGKGDVPGLYVVSVETCTSNESIERIEKIIEKEGEVDLIVLDPLRSVYKSNDTTNAGEVSMAMERWQQLLAKHDAACIGIGHAVKGDIKWGSDALKGAQEQNAALRAVYLLHEDYFGIVKGNRVPDEEKQTAQLLEWSEVTFTWSNTMQREYHDMLNKHVEDEKRKYDITWEAVFGEDEKLKLDEIVRRVQISYPDITDRTVRTYVSADLEKVTRGIYKMKGKREIL